MKKTISLLFFTCILCLAGYSQYTVTASEGAGNAKLGMPIASIIKLIGEPSSTVSYEVEKKDWEEAGYNTSDKMVFGIAFDKVFIFDNPNHLAIWKIYTNKDTAVIFNLSSYVHGKDITKNITTNNGFSFYNDSLVVKNNMGNDFEKKIDEHRNTHFNYPSKGILFIVNENEVRNMFIFREFEVRPIKKEPCSNEENKDSIVYL